MDTPKYEDTSPVDYNETLPMEEATSPVNSDISELESAARGGVQGLTLGTSDEIAGALGAATSPGAILSSDDKLGKLKELYEKYRDMERTKNAMAEQANPKSYFAGNVAGGLVIPGLGEVGAISKAGALAKFFSPTNVKGAMTLGAAAGLGTSEADSVAGDASNALLGAGLGAVGHGVAKTIGNALSPSALKKEAEQSLAYAAGAKGMESNRQKIGEALLKSGSLKEGVSEQGFNRIREAAAEAEKNLQPMLAKAGNVLQEMNPEEVAQSVGGDAGDKVYKLLQDALDKMSDMSSDVTNEFSSDIAPKVQDYILKLKAAGNDPVRLNQIKRAAYQQASDIYAEIVAYKRANQIPPRSIQSWERMAADIGETIKTHIEDLANLADPGLGTQIAQNNRQAGGLIAASRALGAKLIKGDQGIKLSSGAEHVYNPKWAIVKDVIKNLGSEDLAVAKANAMGDMSKTLGSTVGEKPAQALSAITKKTIASPESQEVVQEFNPFSSKKDPQAESNSPARGPAGDSKNLYSMSDDQLSSVADTLNQEKGYEHYGSALQRALANKDMAARNAALFVLASQPDTRRLLKERGLIAE